MVELKLISHGAEAKIFEDTQNNLIYKYRLPKSYRIKELDNYIIKKRTKSEVRILESLKQANINVPKLKRMNLAAFKDTKNSNNENNNIAAEFTTKNTICMEKVQGITVKDYIHQNMSNEEVIKSLFHNIARLIHTIHSKDIVHGDITTCNFLIAPDNEIYAIDFGLSFTTKKVEDKAVDLYVFEKALKCDYIDENYEKYISWFYEVYADIEILQRLEKVRLRGRKREENAIG